ncbi:MAG: lipoate--protein ligase [Clostridia bacterium]|nr:lipoate--protein ligase [Clostridia bacterium]
MISKLKWIVSQEYDPYGNIALEKYLTTHASPEECILFLWQNRQTVVIGRNQNAWTECRVRELMEDGGRLARRLSGGGAVYHDLGNLNFSFMAQKQNYDTDRQSRVILLALNRLGIRADKTGRNDFEVSGRKISGNAFYETQGCCCHHGTVMVDVDTGAMEKYLSVSPGKLRSKGVPSVRARVVNLAEIRRDISIQALQEALLCAFEEIYALAPEAVKLDRQAEDKVQAEKRRLSSPSWLFPPRIPFSMEVSGRFPWGGIQIELNIRQNLIQEAVCHSDAMDERMVREVRRALTGCPFDAEALKNRLLEAAMQCEGTAAYPRGQIAQDITALIRVE